MSRVFSGRKGLHNGAANNPGFDLDPLYCFLIAVGYKVPWTAISSLLHQLNQQFQQPRVLLWLNLAYFLPTIPALLLHSSLQDWLEHKWGVHRTALARFVVGLGSLVLLCLVFPACSSSLPSLLAVTAAVGVAYSIAFGTSHQLVPRFNQRCTVALTTGFVSCGIVILLADLWLKPHAASYTPAALARLFQIAAAQTLLGLLAAALLLRKHWRRLQAAGKQQHHVIGVLPPSAAGVLGRIRSGSSGSSRQLLLPPRGGWSSGHVAGAVGFRNVAHNSQQGFAAAAVSSPRSPRIDHSQAYGFMHHSSTSDPAVHVMVDGHDQSRHVLDRLPAISSSSSSSSGSSSPRYAPSKHHSSSRGSVFKQQLRPLVLLLQLMSRIWPAWLALLLSVGSSMLLFPLFTCTSTSGRLGEFLPQALFYARLLGDILGRMVPPAWQLSSSKSVLTAAFIKTKLLVMLVPGILRPALVGGDFGLVFLVTVNWFLSGYINTGAYLLAPRLATLEAQGFVGSSSSSSRGLGRLWWWVLGRRQRVSHGKGHVGHSSTPGQQHAAALARIGPAALRSKAGAVMSLCFQASCFLGLMAAWGLQEVLLSSSHHGGAAAAVTAAAAGGGGHLGHFWRAPSSSSGGLTAHMASEASLLAQGLDPVNASGDSFAAAAVAGGGGGTQNTAGAFGRVAAATMAAATAARAAVGASRQQ